jgi:hypothetical protein
MYPPSTNTKFIQNLSSGVRLKLVDEQMDRWMALPQPPHSAFILYILFKTQIKAKSVDYNKWIKNFITLIDQMIWS